MESMSFAIRSKRKSYCRLSNEDFVKKLFFRNSTGTFITANHKLQKNDLRSVLTEIFMRLIEIYRSKIICLCI